MRIRQLLTSWKFDVRDEDLDRAEQKIKQVKKQAQSFTKQLNAIAGGMASVGRSATLFVTTPIIGVGAAMVKAASDAEETEAKFATVFESIGGEADKAAKDLARGFGLSSVAAKQLLGDTGDLLTGFGFTESMALDLSKKVQGLAVDLASFTNFSGGAEGASQALTKALLGERESVKSLGISILEEDVKAKIASLAAAGELRGETERQQKAYATLQIALEQSGKAQGDYARTSGSLANRTRKLKGQIQDVGVAFGKFLLPLAIKVTTKISEFADRMNNLSGEQKKNIMIVFGVIAAIGPLLLVLSAVIRTVTLVSSAFAALRTVIILARTATLAFTVASLIIPILIAAAVAAIVLIGQDLYGFFTGQKSLIGEWLSSWGSAGEFFKDIAGGIGSVFTWLVDASTAAVDAIVGAFGKVKEAYNEAVNFTTGIFEAIGGFFGGYGGDVALNATQAAAVPATVPGPRPVNNQRTVTQSINVNSNVALTVPNGTPSEQVAIVEQAATKAVDEAWNKKLREAQDEYAEVN